MNSDEIERLHKGQKVWRKAEVQVELAPVVTINGPIDRYRPREYHTKTQELLYEVTKPGQKEVICEAVGHNGGAVYIHPLSCDKFRRAT